MIRTIAAVLILQLSLFALPAHAAEDQVVIGAAPAGIGLSTPPARPPLLPILYAGFAALTAYDVYSTRQGLARGAREANPLMTGVAGNTGAMIALKASLAIGTIVAAERLWKTNKVAAIAVMLASTGVAAIVAGKNARTLGELR